MPQSPLPPLILVVDDDEGLLALIESALQQRGDRVATASSAGEALDWLKKNAADLLLLDLQLGASAGSEFLDDLSRAGRAIPFIIITGQGDERVAVEMMKRGASDYVVKDFQFLDRIPSVVQRTLASIATEKRLAAAEQSARLLQTAVDQNFSPILITDADPADPRIIYANRNFGATFGCDAAELAGQRLSFLEARTSGWGALRVAVKLNKAYMGEVRLRGQARTEMLFECNITPVIEPGAAPAHWAVILRDITTRREAELALFRREEEFRALVANSPDVIARVGRDLRFLYANPAIEKAFGVPAAKFVGRTLREAGMPADVDQLWARKCMETFQKAAEQNFHFSAGASAEPRYYETRVVPEFGPDGKVESVLAITTNVTERKRLESEVLDTSEREQRRFGHDLHDGLGQQLTGLEFTLAGLILDLKNEAPSLVPPFERMGDHIRQTIRQARAMSHGLSPVALDSAGLIMALRELAESTTALTRVTCRLFNQSDLAMEDVRIATHLYRIAQEAVNNALKHGKPKNIAIEVIDSAHAVILIIQDDGKGFSPGNLTGGGMGLRVMRHRAETIGATLQIESTRRHGTRITCTLPKKR